MELRIGIALESIRGSITVCQLSEEICVSSRVGHTGRQKADADWCEGFWNLDSIDSRLQNPWNPKLPRKWRPLKWPTSVPVDTHIVYSVCIYYIGWVTWFLQSFSLFSVFLLDYILCRFLSCKFSLPLRSQSVPGIKGYAISAYTIEHVHRYIKKRGDSPGSRNLMRTWIMSLNCVVS